MAEEQEESSQKTEEPTARRLDQAFQKGQIFSSRELMSWSVLFTGAVILLGFGPQIFGSFVIPLRHLIEIAPLLPSGGMELVLLEQELTSLLLSRLIGPLALILIVAILVGALQAKGMFNVTTLIPKLNRISLRQGFKRIFSVTSVIEFLKSLTKVIILGVITYHLVAPAFSDVTRFFLNTPSGMLTELRDLTVDLFVGFLSALAALAILDFLYQRFTYLKGLRMSKQDIKEEFKETEGDPIIKSRLKRLRQERAAKRMMAAVPNATVVITNPTHYAIALKYELHEMDAPLVVAKGVDHLALRIREVAKAHEIPIIENPPLARGLYESVEVDKAIPPKFYEAVAEVIRYVFTQAGRKL